MFCLIRLLALHFCFYCHCLCRPLLVSYCCSLLHSNRSATFSRTHVKSCLSRKVSNASLSGLWKSATTRIQYRRKLVSDISKLNTSHAWYFHTSNLLYVNWLHLIQGARQQTKKLRQIFRFRNDPPTAVKSAAVNNCQFARACWYVCKLHTSGGFQELIDSVDMGAHEGCWVPRPVENYSRTEEQTRDAESENIQCAVKYQNNPLTQLCVFFQAFSMPFCCCCRAFTAFRLEA